MATIYDVASRAAVSPATVSRVFNGVAVSEAMATRVRRAAAELNYIPNRTARSLRRQRSDVLALIIPDIENPFFTSLARGVEDRAQAAGYSVVLCNSDEEHEKEARYIDIAVSEHMAGIIIAPATEHTDLDAVIARDRHVVAVDRRAHGYDIDAVLVDSVEAGRVGAATLFDQGYQRVACISGLRDVETAQERAVGWREVFLQRCPGIDPEPYLRFANSRVSGGRWAMAELLALSPAPDAVLVANNMMAAGALQHLAASGNGPPAVGMVALGDLPFAALESLGVTVVELPARSLGETAASLLIDRIHGDDRAAQTVILPITRARSSDP